MSKSFQQNVPETKELAEIESEELAGYILEHLHTITEGKSQRFHAGNLALEISRSYPIQEQELVSDAVRQGCQWLKNHDFIYERTENGFFDFTKKGQSVTTVAELLANLTATADPGKKNTDTASAVKSHTFPRIPISAEEAKWIKAVYARLLSGTKVNPVEILVELWGEIPEDFSYRNIDQSLLIHGVDITLLGILHIDPETNFIEKTDQVIRLIRGLIIERPGVEEVTAKQVAEAIHIPVREVSMVFNLIRHLGKFWNGGSGDESGMTLIRVDYEEVKREYLKYKGVESLLDKLYKGIGAGKDVEVISPSALESEITSDNSSWPEFPTMEPVATDETEPLTGKSNSETVNKRRRSSIVIPDKQYFNTGEVCDITGIQAHVLRYWESEFPTLAPQKNRAGQRTYRKRDVEMVLRIKELLYEDQYTIAGAKKRLNWELRLKKEGFLDSSPETLKILLADADPQITEAVQEYMERSGKKVLVAHKGPTAIEAVYETEPDVIILEVNLPDIDGQQVCRHLKADEATKHIPIIFLSANNDVVDKVIGLDLGASDYLTKPFSLRELESRINAVLRNRPRLEPVGKGSASIMERIIRSIEFPPEYHRSGITILSYFADVLRHKNLSEDVKVSIEQSGLNVSLIIESPTGQRELVERTLEAYALVVTGKQPINTLTTDPYEVAELKSQLRIASAQIESQRDLLVVRNADVVDLKSDLKDTKESVKRLEQRLDDDKARFMSLIEKLAEHNADLSIGLKELAQEAARTQNIALSGALENLYKVIERGVKEEDRDEVIQNLTTIQQQDSGVFQRVYDVLIMGAMSGAAGNYLYSWIQAFVYGLPK